MSCPLFMACPLFGMSAKGRFHWIKRHFLFLHIILCIWHNSKTESSILTVGVKNTFFLLTNLSQISLHILLKSLILSCCNIKPISSGKKFLASEILYFFIWLAFCSVSCWVKHSRIKKTNKALSLTQ